jgi:hypothetical protein
MCNSKGCKGMSRLYLGLDRGVRDGQDVSSSGYRCEYMVWLNLFQNRSVIVKTGGIWVSMGV